jgi:hypothetical protein
LAASPQIVGYFFKGDPITLIVVGVCVTLLGRAIRWYLERDARLLRNAVLIAIITWSRQIFDVAAGLLTNEGNVGQLIFSVVIGILIGVASVLVIFVVHRSAVGFFKETEEQVEEFGEG